MIQKIIFLFLSQTLYQLVSSSFSLETNSSNDEYRQFLSEILNKNNIREVVISYGPRIESCKPLDDLIFSEFLIPTIVRTYNSTLYSALEKQNSEILAIECLVDTFSSDTQKQLTTFLDYFEKKHLIKILFYINKNFEKSKLDDLTTIMQTCFNRKYLNVIAFFKQSSSDVDDHQLKKFVYYSYQLFPDFQLKTYTYPENSKIYPNRMRNIKGHQLLTLPFQEIPRLVLAKNKKGQIIMVGYLGRFVHAFADYINATLTYPYDINTNESVFYVDLENMAKNGIIDIASTIIPVVGNEFQNSHTYPIEIIKYCLMIPEAEPLPLIHILFFLRNIDMLALALIFMIIFSCLIKFRKHQLHSRNIINLTRQNSEDVQILPVLKYFGLFEYIINDVAFRGVLGLPFVMVPDPEFIMKLLYILISITGLYLAFIYNAYLQTMLTLVPKTEQARTFAEIYRANKPLFSTVEELEYVNFSDPYLKSPYVVFGNQDQFSSLRNSFNTTYSYFVAKMLWYNYFNIRQELFRKPLFIFSDDACIPIEFLHIMSLAENSIYIPIFNDFLLFWIDFGFMNYWRRNNFLDMVKNKMVSFTDISIDDDNHYINMNALKWVWLLYAIGMFLSILFFLIEIFVKRIYHF